MPGDRDVLRDLARQVTEIAAKPVQNERRDLWRRHNSLQRTRPLIYVRWFACWSEIVPDASLACRDPFLRPFERSMRESILQDALNDDTIVEPWLRLRASFVAPDFAHRWGPPIRFSEKTAPRGSAAFCPSVIDESDIDQLVKPVHRIDEQATRRDFEKLSDAVGDILPVVVNRSPMWWNWAGDISTDIARLLGLEQFMLYMYDRPRWLHRILAFMRDGILDVHAAAEAAGDLRLINHENQATPYARELPDPSPSTEPVRREQLWCFLASQETTLVSPAQFDEFMLQYQIPIMAKFGLSAYGCCEDLTKKIGCLRKAPNLRRIAVTPWADVAECADQIGGDYVMSWRPSPAEMVCRGFDADRVRKLTREALAAAGDCHVDVTLKDVETVGGDFNRLVEWTRITREVIDEMD